MGHKPEMGAIQPVRLYGEGDRSVTVTPEGKLSVDAQVTAEVADSKIKGSTDAGTTWVPVRVNSSGQLEVALSGRTAVLTTLVSAQAITDTTIRNVTFDASPYRQIDFIIRNSLDSEVAIGFRMPDSAWFSIIDDDGTPRAYTPDPAQSGFRWHRVPTGLSAGVSRYFMLSQIPLNDGKFKAPFRDYLFTADIRYRAVNTPTVGSLSIILVGVPN